MRMATSIAADARRPRTGLPMPDVDDEVWSRLRRERVRTALETLPAETTL
jgi:hypothetical protein